MENITKVEQSTLPQSFGVMCGTIGWDVAPEDSMWWFKVAMSGITDYLNTVKNKTTPSVILVQDLKGNKIIFACVQYIPSENEDEEATGSWTYFWSWNTEDIPENATIYTIDQEQVQKVILQRGYDLCKMTVPTLSYISQLSSYMFSLIHDTLDQQAVEEGGTWVLEMDGFFEATVSVQNGEKIYSFEPKGEMKLLIKDDASSEK